MKQILLTLGAIAAGAFAPAIQASTIDQAYTRAFPATVSGTLPNQGSVLLETFTLTSPSDVTIDTTSYAAGGFETNLELFDSSGDFVTAGSPSGVEDPTTGIIGDSSLTAPDLPASTYTLALTDFLLNQSITATNLSDGFTENYGSGTNFVDADGNTRSGNYGFTIQTSAVPEPSTLWFTTGLLLVALAIRAGKNHRPNA